MNKTNDIPEVELVNRNEIYPAFGYAKGNKIVIRNDLAPVVKRFVISHETYHVFDKSSWGGWIGKEIRANVYCVIKDPVGFMATIAASCNKDRILFYRDRFRRKY